jgi:hypothetical protein
MTPDLFAFVGIDQIEGAFSPHAAKEQALDLWNQTVFGQPSGQASFVECLRSIFDRFFNLVKRKSFVERRIHRYLRDHARFLLPDHRRCLFEHDLVLQGQKRPADFILERDAGLPALLIELETPSARLFTTQGEPTKQTNHARAQIAEWVRFIDENPQNTDGDMAFLRGPKDRLVVISTGLEWVTKMLESRYTDTILWTYDLLLREAKVRWNVLIAAQRSALGLPDVGPLFGD